MNDARICDSDSSEQPSLYELHAKLTRCSDSAEIRTIIGAILDHQEMAVKLRISCRTVLRRWRFNQDLRLELEQQTKLLLIELMSNGRRTYRDIGPREFSGWMSTVVRRTAHRAWNHCRPFWATWRSYAALPPILTNDVSINDSSSDWDELCAAIRQIRDPLTRQIMEELCHGLTVNDSARAHKLASSSITRRRQCGTAELRRIWFGHTED